MKKLSHLTLAAMFIAVASPAFAQEYKSAGCGLGSLAFKEEGPTQILGSTTNATFGTQTFGMSFGTSNCPSAFSSGSSKEEPAPQPARPHPTKSKKRSALEQQQFMATNYEHIKIEMAQGNGEHLTALAATLGCNAQATSKFNTYAKKNYRKLMANPSQNSAQFLSTLRQQMMMDSELANGCTALNTDSIANQG